MNNWEDKKKVKRKKEKEIYIVRNREKKSGSQGKE